MSFAIPIYHWFHNGNPYSGAEGGMRYIIEPGKRPDPNDPAGKKKVEYLVATIWPGPWSREHTAEEKQQSAEFAGDQAGLDAAITLTSPMACSGRSRRGASRAPSTTTPTLTPARA